MFSPWIGNDFVKRTLMTCEYPSIKEPIRKHLEIKKTKIQKETNGWKESTPDVS